MARTVTYSSKINPLRQGQRLDTIDQKPKHDSSKTEVTLDAVMQEVEGKRGNQEPNKAETPNAKLFPLTNATLSTMMHPQSPVHNKFFKNQTSITLVRSLL